MGSEPNGTDSIVKQIAPATHWPEMRILILVVCIIHTIIALLNMFTTIYSSTGE